jgi:hypothetical protein
LVSAVDVGDSGIVESLGCVTEWLTGGRLPGSAMVIHDGQINKRLLDALLAEKTVKKSS